MRKTLILSLAAFAVALSSANAVKPPEGAFLKSRVGTVEQLAQQVIDDAIVAARYAKHYRMSRNDVVSYFQVNLRIGKLRSDYETTVYTVSGQTDISPVKKILTKGAYVFILPDGQPLLEGKTGNPLGDELPLIVSSGPKGIGASEVGDGSSVGAALDSGNAGTISEVVETTGEDGVVAKVLGTPAAEIGALPGTAIPGGADAMPIVLPSVVAGVEPIVDVVASMPVGTSGSFLGLSNLNAVLPIAAVLGGAALAGGGGGGTSASSPVEPPAQVPEPASLLALALGGSSILMGRIKRRG